MGPIEKLRQSMMPRAEFCAMTVVVPCCEMMTEPAAIVGTCGVWARVVGLKTISAAVAVVVKSRRRMQEVKDASLEDEHHQNKLSAINEICSDQ